MRVRVTEFVRRTLPEGFMILMFVLGRTDREVSEN